VFTAETVIVPGAVLMKPPLAIALLTVTRLLTDRLRTPAARSTPPDRYSGPR